MRLRGGLIVSVQAWKGSALDDPYVIAAMARAAQDSGAVAVRVAGEAHLRAVRTRVESPIVGLIKREYDGFAPYITPTLDEVARGRRGGAEIVAFDATARPRPGGATVAAIVDAIASRRLRGDGRLCDVRRRGARLAHSVRAIVATTLCGYTPETAGQPLPALGLVRELAQLDAFVVCEGGVTTPDAAAGGARRGSRCSRGRNGDYQRRLARAYALQGLPTGRETAKPADSQSRCETANASL